MIASPPATSPRGEISPRRVTSSENYDGSGATAITSPCFHSSNGDNASPRNATSRQTKLQMHLNFRTVHALLHGFSYWRPIRVIIRVQGTVGRSNRFKLSISEVKMAAKEDIEVKYN